MLNTDEYRTPNICLRTPLTLISSHQCSLWLPAFFHWVAENASGINPALVIRKTLYCLLLLLNVFAIKFVIFFQIKVGFFDELLWSLLLQCQRVTSCRTFLCSSCFNCLCRKLFFVKTFGLCQKMSNAKWILGVAFSQKNPSIVAFWWPLDVLLGI